MPKEKEEEKKTFMKVSNSRKLYLPIYFMILILIAVVIFIKYNGLPLTNLVLILAGLFIFFSVKFTELHRFSNSYEIDKNSYIHIRGIFNRRSRSMDFLAISSIEVKQNLWQRLLDYGDVRVRLYSGESESIVKDINNPAEFGRFLREMMHIRRKESSRW